MVAGSLIHKSWVYVMRGKDNERKVRRRLGVGIEKRVRKKTETCSHSVGFYPLCAISALECASRSLKYHPYRH